ncbi:MAG: DNA (cytosine-5-)-methyltransferase [Bacteroidota bacterium]
MRYFSTFSGIGGFELGIQSAYAYYSSLWSWRSPKSDGALQTPAGCLAYQLPRSFNSRDSSNAYGRRNAILDSSTPKCVGYSEKDPYASAIYRYHFPKHQAFGDITTINAKRLPDFDLLVGGFPCQAFSIAGNRQGFNDERGTLFFELARIIKQKRPRFLLLENVKGLLSHQQGQTFSTILNTLSQLGYDQTWQVLNSKHFGVPQNRERVYIMGYLRKAGGCQVLPLGQAETLYPQTQTNPKGLCAATLTARQFASWNGNYIQEEEGAIRRLTPLECERLQAFPDNWTANGINQKGKEILVSDSRRYKAIGNAVTVNVVQAIMIAFFINLFTPSSQSPHQETGEGS